MPHAKRTFSGVLGGVLGVVGLSAVAGLLVTVAVTPAIALSGYTAKGAITMFENIPGYLEVDQPMLPTTIYAKDSNGKNRELATFYDQNRIPVEYDDVPQIMYDAILASEDPRYYEHGGVDLIGTSRALLSNVAGGATQGGSSISQQFVKNVLVQRCEAGTSDDLPEDFKELGPEDRQQAIDECYLDQTESIGTEGYQRKLQEMRYAISIEKEYSKEEILLGYLNYANFGGQTYGIAAASKRYFGKSIKDINVGEAAILAGIVQNPNLLRIDRPEGTRTDSDGEAINGEEDGYSYAKSRQRYVLNQMLEEDMITQDQHEQFFEAPLEPKITSRDQGCQQAGSSAYFCQYVKSVVLNDETFGETAEDRRQTLQRGGLKIYTTLNPDIQKTAAETMSRNAASHIDGMDFGAASVSVEADTGRILSMVQNTKFTENAETAKEPGYSSLVYAADSAHGSSNGFQPGSAYKLFTLIGWLEAGRSVNETLDGTDQTFTNFSCDGDPVYNSTHISNFGGNRGYIGTPMQFTSASLNTGFLAMASQIDLCEINRIAEKMGVTLGNGGSVTDDNTPYGTTLGSKNIAPIDIASAFATVANGGVYCDQRAIDKVIDADGEEMELPAGKCERVLEKNVAATAAYALQGVMNGGTGGAANPGDGVPVLGKTGTHQHFQTFMVESSTKAATATWVGNSQGQASLSAYGLNYLRFNITRDIQYTANAVLGGEGFPEPDSELTKVVLADLPNVVGMSVDEARRTLEAAGFSVSVSSAVPGTQAEGLVQRQSPGGGSAPGGSHITIYPSNGNGVEVPNVEGQSLPEARGAMQSAGLDTALGSCQERDGAGSGQVRATDPAAGDIVSSGTTVRIGIYAKNCGGGGNDDDDDD